jgi:hypothetical protein
MNEMAIGEDPPKVGAREGIDAGFLAEPSLHGSVTILRAGSLSVDFNQPSEVPTVIPWGFGS